MATNEGDWTGVANSKPTIDGGTINNAAVGGTTPAAGAFTTLTASGATTLNGTVALGNATTDTIGFYGTTKITQRSGAVQGTSLVGTASSTDIDTATKAAIIEIMNTLAAIGIWKGSA